MTKDLSFLKYNAGNEIQSFEGMLNFISSGVIL